MGCESLLPCLRTIEMSITDSGKYLQKNLPNPMNVQNLRYIEKYVIISVDGDGGPRGVSHMRRHRSTFFQSHVQIYPPYQYDAYCEGRGESRIIFCWNPNIFVT